jgi:hypothetical protein
MKQTVTMLLLVMLASIAKGQIDFKKMILVR